MERVRDRLRKKYRVTKMIFVRGEVRCSGGAAGSGCVCASSSRASCSRPWADSEFEEDAEDEEAEITVIEAEVPEDAEGPGESEAIIPEETSKAETEIEK